MTERKRQRAYRTTLKLTDNHTQPANQHSPWLFLLCILIKQQLICWHWPGKTEDGWMGKNPGYSLHNKCLKAHESISHGSHEGLSPIMRWSILWNRTHPAGQSLRTSEKHGSIAVHVPFGSDGNHIIKPWLSFSRSWVSFEEREQHSRMIQAPELICWSNFSGVLQRWDFNLAPTVRTSLHLTAVLPVTFLIQLKPFIRQDLIC